jgi:S1 RNA binding domain.
MTNSIRKGRIVKGKVTGIQPFGAFVNLGNNRNGLIHISEITEGYVKDIHDYFRVGDIVTARIISVDEKAGKISLSLKGMGRTGRAIPGKRPATSSGRKGFRTLEEKLKEWIEQSEIYQLSKK